MSFNQFNIDEYVRLLMQLQQQPASQQNIINRQAAAPSMDSFQNFVRSHDDLQLPQLVNNGIQSASFVHAANANSNQLAAAGNISAQQQSASTQTVSSDNPTVAPVRSDQTRVSAPQCFDSQHQPSLNSASHENIALAQVSRLSDVDCNCILYSLPLSSVVERASRLSIILTPPPLCYYSLILMNLHQPIHHFASSACNREGIAIDNKQ